MGRTRIVLDTHIFITETFDKKYNKKIKLILSNEIVKQINRVAKRLRNKDFAGLLQYQIWSEFDIEFVSDGLCEKLKKKYKGKVPRKDLGIFVTAVGGKTDYLVSDNREFIKKA